MSSTSPYPKGQSDNTDELRQVFIRRVHRLIKLGYDRMNPSAFQAEEEPAITGELVRAIDTLCGDPQSEEWMTYYSAHDDPPVNDPVRKGKGRRRVDIRVDSSECRPRIRFFIEAKRLGDRNPVRKYLGREGLGCFLWGDYARDEDTAGMLGYVQSGDPRDWAEKIEATLAKSPDSYGVLKTSPWQQQALIAGLQHTYRSGHGRKTLARPIQVYHTLLTFH
jgi:hypothetical protein